MLLLYLKRSILPLSLTIHLSLFLSAVGKFLVKVVYKHLFNCVCDQEILSALQPGFIPGDSTVNQLRHV